MYEIQASPGQMYTNRIFRVPQVLESHDGRHILSSGYRRISIIILFLVS